MKKLLLGSVGTFAILAVIVGGTTAFFSSQASVNGNAFAAGTLNLLLSAEEGSAKLSEINPQWNFTAMAPGGTPETASVWLHNTGTIDGQTLSLAIPSGWTNPSNIAAQMRITELTLDGENLLTGGAGPRERVYEAPESCDILVGSSGEANHTTIQAGLDAAAVGEVVCVEPGTYTEDLSMVTDGVTLVSLEGPQTTIIDADETNAGIAIGDFVSGGGSNPDNVTVQGFTVQNWQERGIAQRNGDGIVFIYDNIVVDPAASGVKRGGIILSGSNGGSEVIGNMVGVPTFGDPDWISAAILLIGTDNAVVEDNTVQGVDIGIAIAGYPGFSSSDPSWTESRGVIVRYNSIESTSDGIGILGDVDNLTVELNEIVNSGVGVNQVVDQGGTPGDNNLLSQNNLINNEVAVRNNVAGTSLNAQNNWWGGFTPTTGGDGDIDSSNFAGGPFAGFINGTDYNDNGFADLRDLRELGLSIPSGLDSGESKEFVMSVQLDGPTTDNTFQGKALEGVVLRFTLEQI